jgi:hypothetical protein
LFDQDQLSESHLDNFAEKFLADNEEDRFVKDCKTHDSIKAATISTSVGKSQTNELLTEKQRKDISKENEEDKNSQQEILIPKPITDVEPDDEFNFDSRIRFSKQHDRGKQNFNRFAKFSNFLKNFILYTIVSIHEYQIIDKCNFEFMKKFV